MSNRIDSSSGVSSVVLCLCSMLLLPLDMCCCEWTGGLASPLQHHDESAESYTTAFINVTYRDPLTGRLQSEKSEMAKFGGAHVYPAHGLLVHVSSAKDATDHTGCHLPLRRHFDTEPWIALVRRGGCNFQVKIDNAFRSNATGVIVYNDRDKPLLEKMKLSPVHVSSNLSAVFTYKWKGEELAQLVDNGTRVYAHVTIASHCTRPYNTINRTSVLFVSISFIVLMIISLAWLVFYYVQRFRYIHAKDRLSRRLCTAAKKALSKIPTKYIKAEDKEIQGDGECCAICIEPYKPSEIVRILPCKHEFHRSCIDPWLLEHRTCPMCKMDILKHYGFIFTGSQESILHVDIEEAISETESMHRPSLSPVPSHQLQATLQWIIQRPSETPTSDSVRLDVDTDVNFSPEMSSGCSTPTLSNEEYLPSEFAVPDAETHPTDDRVMAVISSLDRLVADDISCTSPLSPRTRRTMSASSSLDYCNLPSTSHSS